MKYEQRGQSQWLELTSRGSQWVCGGKSRPVRVSATCSKGVAKKTIERDTEDTISLSVQWETPATGSCGGATAAVQLSVTGCCVSH